MSEKRMVATKRLLTHLSTEVLAERYTRLMDIDEPTPEQRGEWQQVSSELWNRDYFAPKGMEIPLNNDLPF